MEESHHHRVTATSSSSQLGLCIRPASNSTMPGDIVEAPRGGHIIKSTGRKDRHSKVCTAKGPRDRRVRLAAHTAIQFYDVQDRLGYDRPSKAVDWLIKKAKAAIDELDELPPWQPPPPNSSASPNLPPVSSPHEAAENSGCVRFSLAEEFSGDRRMVGGGVAELVNNQNSLNFLPPSMHSDSIAGTIKSFHSGGDLLSRTSSQNQDLRLSLQSFQDPILQLHHHHHHQQQNEQAFLGFDISAATWQEHHHNQQQHQQQQQAELNRFQRMLTWSNAGGGGETNHHNSNSNSNNGGGGGRFTFSSLPLSHSPQPFLFGQSQLFTSQRGPLQSSNAPSIHAWIDQNDNITDHQHHQMAPSTMHHQQQSSVSGMGYASGVFPGFHIPTRIQGEEEHDGISDKPSSASSNSRH